MISRGELLTHLRTTANGWFKVRDSKADEGYLYRGDVTSTGYTEEQPDDKNIEVIRIKTGSKYHLAGCPTLRSQISLTLKEAKRMGLEPCKACNPTN